MKEITRYAAALALVGLTATACASDKSEALSLAKEACNMSLPDVEGDPLTDDDSRSKHRDALLPELEKMADKAAQAARRDGTWQQLATAADEFAKLVSVIIELGDLRDTRVGSGYSNAADVDKDAHLEERRTALSKGMEDFVAECRKTTG